MREGKSVAPSRTELICEMACLTTAVVQEQLCEGSTHVETKS